MLAVALISLYAFDAVPFKVIYTLFAIVAGVELVSFFTKKRTKLCFFLATIEIILLICSIIYMIKLEMPLFWYIILGVSGYDIFAYLFGKALGGKVFGKARPFPHVSKNKTWEGTILGLMTATMLVIIMLAVRGTFGSEWMFLLCAPLALVGDLYESLMKRKFSVKDSNEIIIKNPVAAKLELIVGGTEGHGGFLDRIDSVALATTVLLVIDLIMKAGL